MTAHSAASSRRAPRSRASGWYIPSAGDANVGTGSRCAKSDTASGCGEFQSSSNTASAPSRYTVAFTRTRVTASYHANGNALGGEGDGSRFEPVSSSSALVSSSSRPSAAWAHRRR